MVRTTAITVLAGALAGLAALPCAARDLSFEDRVRYQRAIEDVYWSHRIWPKENSTPKPPLSAVMTDEAIRARVEDYLKKSTALEAVWHRRVTGEQLQAELDRIVRDTRSADTLEDLFQALGDDPFVIAETLARQTLVDRLVRDWYASDARFHGETKRRAEAARASCRTVAQMRTMGGEYREVAYARSRDDASEWEDHRASLERRLPGAGSLVGRVSELEETEDGFSVIGVLSDGADRTQLAMVTWPKTTFDAWWSRERTELSATAGATTGPYELASPSATCAEDTWGPPMKAQNLRARVWQAGVWTGSEMIIWSGRPACSTCSGYLDGARYSPATDTWGQVPKFLAPTRRLDHTAVWTGTEMIVWGGAVSGTRHVAGDLNLPFPQTLNTGGRYNPMTQTWTPTSTGAGVPTSRQGHTAVWTGSVMVVWGGFGDGGADATGALYDPSSDSWTATSSVGAPSARYLHTAVWTGSQMIVWGGTGSSTIALNDGARFDPTSNTWTSTSNVAAPPARYEHTAVWDGNAMIVWGGDNSSSVTNTGGRYLPATDTWTATSTTAGVASARLRHSAVWTGTRMIVWGGQSSANGAGVNTGSSYDPVTQAWTPVPTLNAPSARFSTTAVWTGTEMIVWGGASQFSPVTVLNTGGRYDPASQTWIATPLTSPPGPPSPRYKHASVWTGSEMIVWGGYPSTFGGPCGRYVPATNSWIFPAGGDPNGREYAAAVWTGTEMLVWGGAPDSSNPSPLGQRFNPSSNAWSTISDINAPSFRAEHTAVWTGNVMVVWGGRNPSTQVAPSTGGRYNPATNSWAATSLTGAPSPRVAHRAVWTGSSMVLWGGTLGGSTGLDTGARYDPVGDTWTSTSLGPGVPSPRFGHATVWTGSRMIVWGGSGVGVGSTGALYDPVADIWSAMSAGANVPTERQRASAVWTGTEMIVWGGLTSSQAPLNTGGRYNPVSDTWAPMSTSPNTPIARYAHAAEWTGREMVVWGGNDNVSLEADFFEAGMSSGGAYCVNGCAQPLTFYRDADGDGFGTASLPALACAQPVGFSASSTDCNDLNPGIHPGATEQCDGVDRNCDGFSDTGILGEVTIEAWPSWTPVPGALYDVVRGAIGTWPVGSNPTSEVCAADNVPDTSHDDPDDPAVGTGFWYLVRAVNSCGNGTLGFRAVGGVPTTERISAACP